MPSLGFSMYSIVPSKQCEFYFLLSNLDSFYFFSSLIAVAGTSKTLLINNNGKSEHPCLVPNLRGYAFSFLPLRIIAVGLSDRALIMLRYDQLYILMLLLLRCFSRV